MTGAGPGVGGGGRAPGDIVSGMRPALPMEPGGSWAKAVLAPTRATTTATEAVRKVRGIGFM